MAKKKSKLWMIPVSIIIVAILFLSVYFGVIRQTNVPDCLGGLTITSVSNAQYIESDESPTGKPMIQFNVVTNQGGQCAIINPSLSDLNNQLKAEGVQAKKTLTFDVASVLQESVFSTRVIDSQKVPLAKKVSTEFNVFNSVDKCNIWLKNRGLPQTAFGYTPAGDGTKTVCYYRDDYGTMGNFIETSENRFQVGF